MGAGQRRRRSGKDVPSVRRLLPLTFVLVACQGNIKLPDPLAVCADPGQVSLRRLNNVEYDNSLRDLLGDTTAPATNFPADPSVSFDNNGDALSMSPMLVELYANTAATVVDSALAPPPMPISEQDQAKALADAMCPGGNAPAGADYTCFGYLPGVGTAIEIWNDMYYVDHLQTVPANGDYTLSVRVYDAAPAGTAAQLEIDVDGKKVYLGNVTAPSSAPVVVTQSVTLSAGSHRIQLINANTARSYDRDLGVDWEKIEGPTNMANAAQTAFRNSFFACDPTKTSVDDCATQILQPFARKAYRRAVTMDEITPLVALVHTAMDQGDDFQTGIRLALRRILTSADFLFKVETDASPSDLTPHPLNPFELATRLSYFLWASTPDDELLSEAESGHLSDPAVLEMQARRMLDDQKAAALVDVFAAQWFRVRAFQLSTPSSTVFPEFDAPLRDAMTQETLLFLQSFLFEDHSGLDLLDANYTYLNDTLATHYGVTGVSGSAMQKVTLTTTQRGGLLTQGSVLTVTSQPNRTSPVRRGKWVLDNILCQPPPPPPPNVPAIPSDGMVAGATLRQLTEEHRANPVCNGCHIQMDPIGYAMEHYDGVGHWRDQDNGQPIDATGSLPSGANFDGAQQLAQVLKADPRFTTCMSKKMLTYALGRELTPPDDCLVNALTQQQAANGYRLSELAVAVVKSPAFRNRRPGKAASTP